MTIKSAHIKQLDFLVEELTLSLWGDFEVNSQEEMDEIVANLRERVSKIQSPEIEEE